MQAKQDLIIVIVAIVATLIFLGMIFLFLIVYYKGKKRKVQLEKEQMQQSFSQQLLQSQIETQEETMSILGKELHDNVGQLLSSTKMLIGITERSLDNPPATLLTANETLSKAIHELRSLSKSLNKEWLEQFNFIENIKAEATRINSSGMVTLQFTHPTALPLKADEQLILFRIVQEAIQNALKHAKASHISIDITEQHQVLHLNIADNGQGFTMEQPKQGLGIINIRHRTSLLGGTANWTSNSKGTTIAIQLPIKASNPS
jgi:signal transduction histidine kinase